MAKKNSISKEQSIDEAAQGWFVVMTKVNHELVALNHLRRQGFEAYLPMRSWLHAGSQRVRKGTLTSAPAFPSYLFVENPMGDPADTGKARPAWQAIPNTIGVARMFLSGEVPVVLRSAVIEAIRRREEAERRALGQEQSMDGDLEPGQPVRVTFEDGFTELDGIFGGDDGANHVCVLFELLGKVHVQTVHLARVAPSPSAVAVQDPS